MIAQAVDTELPPVRWSTPYHAYHWAEELVSRPQCQSATGAVISALKGNQMRGASGWSAQDYRDLAETVLVCISGIPDIHGRNALRAVHGVDVRDICLWLAVDMARVLMGAEEAKLRTYSQVYRVAAVAIERERVAALGRKRPGLVLYAQRLDVARERLYDKRWRALITAAELMLQERIQRGADALAVALQERGLW